MREVLIMFKFKIACTECSHEFEVNLDELDCESRGASGNRMTSYECEGTVICPECGAENQVTITAEIADETGEVLDWQ